MPRYLCLLFITIFFWTCCIPTASATPSVVVDGKPISFDVPPAIENDHLLIPLRAVLQAMDAIVEWNPNSNIIVVRKGVNQINLIIGESTANCNGKIVDLDAPAKLIAGRTMVPLRFLSEAFGMTVNWVEFDKEHQIIVLRNPLIAYKSGLLHYTSRQTKWGQSLDEVMDTEPSLPVDAKKGTLLYSEIDFQGISGDLGYFFVDNSLALTMYDFHGDKKSADDAVNTYDIISGMLTDQYGQPVARIQNPKNDNTANWESNRVTEISSGNLNLFTAWLDEYTMVCLFLNDAGENLGMVFSDIDQVDTSLLALLGRGLDKSGNAVD